MQLTPSPTTQHILHAVWRVVRRIEQASSELEQSHHITAAQYLCLRALVKAGSLTQIELSRQVHLSASTLVGIIDRLETKGLVHRTRDVADRRRIHIAPSHRGRVIERNAPEPLHHTLERGLSSLPPGESLAIAEALDALVRLLEADGIDAAPVLTSGPLLPPTHEHLSTSLV